MPDGHPIEIMFPLKGVSATLARQAQPDGTAAPESLLNVMPYDRLGRGRGAQRRGCSRLFNQLANAGVMAMGQAALSIDPTSAPPTNLQLNESFTEYANNTNLNATGNWNAINSTTAKIVNPPGKVMDSGHNSDVFYSGNALSLGQSYSVQITFLYDPAVFTYLIMARANGLSRASSIQWRIDWTGTGNNWTYQILANGAAIVGPTAFTLALTSGQSFTMQLQCSGNNLTGSVNGGVVATAVSSFNNTQTGFGWNGGTAGANVWAITNVAVYSGSAAAYRKNYLTCVCNGNIYQGDLTAMTLVANGTAALNPGVKPRIAWGNGSFYYVDGTTIQQCVIQTAVASALAASAGILPTNCGIVAVWRDRLLLSGQLASPMNIYASRVGTYTDWDYSQTDPAAAFALNASLAGHIGEPVTALIPLTDDLLLIGGDHNLWMMNGDPGAGGTIGLLSDNIGVFSQESWCKAPDGTVYFAGPGGLYRIAGNAPPQEVASGKYLEWFRQINRTTTYVQLVWDRDRHGCYIFQTPIPSGTQGLALWYDQRNDGFFPQQWPNDIGPVSALSFDGDGVANRSVLFGGRSGAVRQELDSATTDDGAAINAFFMVGPYKPGAQLSYMMSVIPGSDNNEGMVNTVDVILGELPPGFTNANWNCTLTLQSHHDANLAVNAPLYSRSKTFTTPGRQRRWLMRQRGVSLYFVFANAVSGTFFSFERATAFVNPAGRERR